MSVLRVNRIHHWPGHNFCQLIFSQINVSWRITEIYFNTLVVSIELGGNSILLDICLVCKSIHLVSQQYVRLSSCLCIWKTTVLLCYIKLRDSFQIRLTTLTNLSCDCPRLYGTLSTQPHIPRRCSWEHNLIFAFQTVHSLFKCFFLFYFEFICV